MQGSEHLAVGGVFHFEIFSGATFLKEKSMKAGIQTLRAAIGLGLLVAGTCAFAAKGFSVTADQEKMVQVGMTKDEVRMAIGRPSHTVKYRNMPGQTWVYSVNHAEYKQTVFDVDFDASGRVQSTGEVVNNSRGGGDYDAE